MITPHSISIVGGMGRMGRLLHRLLEKDGYRVHVADTKSGPISWEQVGQCDVVLLAVPIPHMEDVIVKLGPHTRHDGAVIDIASVKERPVNAMLRHCNGEVIGSHPLFGPAVNVVEGQVLFVCSGGSTRWIHWYRSFWQDQGANVVEIDPANHDRLMASVQVLRHLMLWCFGRALMNLDFDLDHDLPHAGPWFSQLVAMLGHQAHQPPDLYADIALHNPYTNLAAEALGSAVTELSSLYQNTDRPNMTRIMREIARYVLSEVPSN